MSDDLITQRKEKIKIWNDLGFDGYAITFDRTHTSKQARETLEQKAPRESGDVLDGPKNEAKMCGRIMNQREMGKLAFWKLRDVDGDFQVCLAKDIIGENFKTWLKAIDLGDFCGFEGEFFLTKHGEPTLLVTSITPLSKALRPLPEKWAGLKDKEACYRERNLDLATNPETRERFDVRSAVVEEIRNYYENLGFTEIETPVLQGQAGGAMAKVFETHHNALDHEFSLRIALELPLKIACSGGIERVFEIGKCFRNEGTDPSHLQEFTMMEWYAAYEGIDKNKEWNEEMIRQICTNVLGTTKVEVLDKDGDTHEVDFGIKFPEYAFADLLKDHAGLDMFTASDDEVVAKAKEVGVEDTEGVGRANLLDDIYKKTARPNLIQPCFVLDYPEDLKPLARPKGDGTASCFQILIAGWEVVNSYGELIDPTVQRKLFEKQAGFKAAGDDEAMEVDEVFLKAMEHGFPPMTGQGMGIDRLVAILTGQPNLRDVVLFPTMLPEHEKKKVLETNLAVAVVNTDAITEPWMALNTVGHLTAAYGAREGKDLFLMNEIATKDKESIRMNTTHAIMIKQTDTNQKLIDLIAKAKSQNLHVAEFTHEMIATSDDQKVADMTRDKNLKDVQFLGGLIYGKKSVVEALTKEYPLFTDFGGNSADCKSQKPSTNTPKSEFTIFDGVLNREKAKKMMDERCDFALQRHLTYVAASMEAFAKHLNVENPEEWYLAGLLHDIDWNQTIDTPERHCASETLHYLEANGASEDILRAIQAHCHDLTGVEASSDFQKALIACDEISGFAVAVSLMRPTKMIGISPKSIVKKMKDKNFAAAVSREEMKMCETSFEIPVSEFLQILIPAWEAIAKDWELTE